MSDSPDAQLLLKKRARRRLVGAVAFAGLAAVVLPMVMDEEPRQQVRDVQIRIPGQDLAPLALPDPVKPVVVDQEKPVLAPPLEKAQPATVVSSTVVKQEVVAEAKPEPKLAEKTHEKTPEKPVEKKIDKPAEKSVPKPAEKTAVKQTEKAEEKEKTPAEKPAKAKANDAERAVAILNGKANEPMADAPKAGGQHVILIGAFSNPGNVKLLQSKISELGIKVYTESLDSPSGTKTRVRAGPFPNRDAADKALDKMKRIGVNGVVTAK